MPLTPPSNACQRFPAVARARFLPLSSAGVVALLLLCLAALPAVAQMSIGQPQPMPPVTPPTMLPTIEGFVSAVDGTVLTLLGSPLLRVDISGATILSADSTGGTPPPITPGAYIMATLEPFASPMATPLPPPLVAKTVAVRPAGTAVLSGEILSVLSDSFVLLYRTILVDANTVFSGFGPAGAVHGLSDLKPGMQATAWVVPSGSGLLATKVVAYSFAIVPKPFQFRGVVKSIADTSWQIDDKTVGVTADTKIVGDPKVGDTVDVLAMVQDPPNPLMGMPSRIVALLIAKVVPVPPPTPGRTFTFDGIVHSMPVTGTIGLWKIGDRNVMVNGLTKITGTPSVGGLVTVTGYALPSPMTAGASPQPSTSLILATSIVTKP
ncbi:MAG: DUF5666 domain-containing protein [Thermoanaerobaculia bacterium]